MAGVRKWWRWAQKIGRRRSERRRSWRWPIRCADCPNHGRNLCHYQGLLRLAKPENERPGKASMLMRLHCARGRGALGAWEYPCRRVLRGALTCYWPLPACTADGAASGGGLGLVLPALGAWLARRAALRSRRRVVAIERALMPLCGAWCAGGGGGRVGDRPRIFGSINQTRYPPRVIFGPASPGILQCGFTSFCRELIHWTFSGRFGKR